MTLNRLKTNKNCRIFEEINNDICNVISSSKYAVWSYGFIFNSLQNVLLKGGLFYRKLRPQYKLHIALLSDIKSSLISTWYITFDISFHTYGCVKYTQLYIFIY